MDGDRLKTLRQTWWLHFSYSKLLKIYFSSNIPAASTSSVYISQLSGLCSMQWCQMIVWTELSCWCNTYSSKTRLLLGWNYRYRKYMVVITNELIVTTYPLFPLYVDVVFLLSPTRTWRYEYHSGCFSRSRNCFPIRKHMSS